MASGAAGGAEFSGVAAVVNTLGQPCHFLGALAGAFAVRRHELFGCAPDACAERPGAADARVSCAQAAVLLGWLMHEDPAAHVVVTEHIGSVEVLGDVVRQFIVFQDKCGALTDASLVSLHAVMLSIQAHG